jgi:3-isopropylmalate dehydrogenase
MMIEHIGVAKDDAKLLEQAKKIRSAYERCLAEGRKTRDLGGDLGTDAFTDAVIERL